ncbi:tryptophan synthase beta subunit-like PLP-dependent enzyme [Moniliophthora roreri]|nr:tryptophan synthase beta subunit-like PLP-dependent enzyme [Moniliophthora roreri]
MDEKLRIICGNKWRRICQLYHDLVVLYKSPRILSSSWTLTHRMPLCLSNAIFNTRADGREAPNVPEALGENS